MARELAEVQAAQPRQEAALAQAAGRQLAEQGARLDALGRNLYAIDPEAPLRLGFALVWDEAKQLVRDASKVSPGARLKVDVKRGSFTARREPAESGSGDGI
jgi:exonuclease VII large subunit